jgi:hypothetical protein
MYEKCSEPLLPRPHFLRRLGLHLLWATGMVAVSLGLGMLGYHTLGKLDWLDAFLNATMLLGGMGPVGELSTKAGKIFAGLFALYAGFVLITVTALLMAPILHRLLHSVHLEDETDEESS